MRSSDSREWDPKFTLRTRRWPAGPGSTLPYRLMWILESSGDDSKSVTFRVRPGEVRTIGRASRADFILEAPLVSRVHCRLEARDDGLDVIDLSSTNGTYVNDERVDQAVLRIGDRLRVGRVEFTVEKFDSAELDGMSAASRFGR
jgi:pSer/pThr/pTyr-binding forkhead associated (FHA) protein